MWTALQSLSDFVCWAHSSPQASLRLLRAAKMQRTRPYHLPVFLWVHCSVQGASACPTLLSAEGVKAWSSVSTLLPVMVSPAKQHERKQGGDTHGGRDWRSKLIPHVPQAETFQAAPAHSAGGRLAECSELTSQHFPALFAHILLSTESTRFHLAQRWHHKAQFTFLASIRAP